MSAEAGIDKLIRRLLNSLPVFFQIDLAYKLPPSPLGALTVALQPPSEIWPKPLEFSDPKAVISKPDLTLHFPATFRLRTSVSTPSKITTFRAATRLLDVRKLYLPKKHPHRVEQHATIGHHELQRLMGVRVHRGNSYASYQPSLGLVIRCWCKFPLLRCLPVWRQL